MNAPQIYNKVNGNLRKESEYFLESFLHKANWNDGEHILDIGVGDGATTLQVLLPRLPQNILKLHAMDSSERMLEFAKQYNNHPKIEYWLNNILEEVSNGYTEFFHHVFSFYCLHWVNQELALSNIFKMLRNDGEIFLLFLVKTPLDEVFTRLSNNIRWIEYDHKRYISSYRGLLAPEFKLQQTLKGAGFLKRMVKIKNVVEHFSNFKHFCDFFISINPLITKIKPDDMFAYTEDYIDALKVANFYEEMEGGEIKVPYQLFQVYGKKSFKNPTVSSGQIEQESESMINIEK